MSNDTTKEVTLAANEGIKVNSRYLRGTILEGLSDSSTGAVSGDDNQLLKFHGSYQQDDRDLRKQRRKEKLEKAFSFMIRVRVPGGVCSSEQYMKMLAISEKYADGALTFTTRQAFQFHRILKKDLKLAMKGINEALMTSIAACGDVNRNVMLNANPHASDLHEEVYQIALSVQDLLTPKTKAYDEIWMDVKPEQEEAETVEPLYGKTYLPRKFKVGMAVPPENDIDIYSQDLGYIAIEEKGKLTGFNVLVGGGMGMSHGNEKTYARLGSVIGFCTPDQVASVSENTVAIQRDFGDRTDRKHARFKYTIDDKGLDWFVKELAKRTGFTLEAAKPFEFISSGDAFGWIKGSNNLWSLTIHSNGGRVGDDTPSLKNGLKSLIELHQGEIRLTPNKNILLTGISDGNKLKMEAVVDEFKIGTIDHKSGARLNSIACVALPTCGLALSESSRHLPLFLDDFEAILNKNGLFNQPINVRITGCPNGCGRTPLAEIGLVGKAPGKWNLRLGASHSGDRLNLLYKQALTHEEILAELSPIVKAFADKREPEEGFGDFCMREGYVS